MFESVNYTYYSNELGRAVVPDEETFNKYVLEATTYMRQVMPALIEREQNAFDKCACLIVEELYNEALTGYSGRIETSRSVDGVSQSFEVSKAETLYTRQNKWVDAFCIRRSF